MMKTGRVVFAFAVVATVLSPAAAGSPRVAVWGDQADRLADVVAKIQGAGAFANVDAVVLNTQGVPTLSEALAYDSILIFGGANSWGSSIAAGAGDVLADYADAGRGVVVATFVLGSGAGGWMLHGRWDDSSRYYAMVPVVSQTRGHQTIGTRHVPDHPLLAGVNTFDGGINSYRAPITDFVPGAVRIADWSSGTPLLAAKELENMGRRVDLNFYPPSSDSREDFWLSSTDGDVLLANAVAWAAIPEPAGLALLALGGVALIRRRRK
ncbi:MAG: PEP-CTERM sorting domain-containing protein [Phycisphaerae bacterium]